MRNNVFLILVCISLQSFASVDPYGLRRQVYGDFVRTTDVNAYVFGSDDLVIFSNGYVLRLEEYERAWNLAKRDTTPAAKAKFLDDMILSYQRVFEAMEQGLDTSIAFQLEFLKYKQDKLSPYLDEGYTRIEAEALPEFKYFIRQYYNGMILFELMNKEVWTKANMDNGALRNFYNDHLALYQGHSFETARSKVVHDYQAQLEKDLNERVNLKFPSKVNSVLKNEL